ncbi:MAG: magnesium chelatase subunit, partial [Pseudonocardiales bacterium]|nr:magnesium chelatase subunit [Pseudonocardiales bacterium]
VAAAAVRRAALTHEDAAVARVCDLPTIVPASRGKVEFDDADEGREFEVLEHLLRRSVVETFRARLAGLDLRVLQERFEGGLTVTTGDTVGAQDLLTQLGPVPVLSALLDRLEPDGVGEGPAAIGVAASVLEFALEGLYLNRRLAKDTDGARTVYGA